MRMDRPNQLAGLPAARPPQTVIWIGPAALWVQRGRRVG